MHNPPHPGEVLRELHLKETDIPVSEAALRLGVSRQAMSAILRSPLAHQPKNRGHI